MENVAPASGYGVILISFCLSIRLDLRLAATDANGRFVVQEGDFHRMGSQFAKTSPPKKRIQNTPKVHGTGPMYWFI